MIDPDGYRPNVGIILLNAQGHVFWARRVGRDGWQFPQGGMRSDETPIEAMYRELEEETGIPRFSYGFFQDPDLRHHLAADVDKRCFGSQCETGYDHSLNKRMGNVRHQVPVLECSRL